MLNSQAPPLAMPRLADCTVFGCNLDAAERDKGWGSWDRVFQVAIFKRFWEIRGYTGFEMRDAGGREMLDEQWESEEVM